MAAVASMKFAMKEGKMVREHDLSKHLDFDHYRDDRFVDPDFDDFGFDEFDVARQVRSLVNPKSRSGPDCRSY